MAFLKVSIGVEVSESEVRDWLADNNIKKVTIEDEDYIEYAESKYGYGLGAEASFGQG